jgi:predicted Zn-dependent protease
MALDRARAQRVLGEVLALARRAAPRADVVASLVSGRTANTRFARSEITSTGDVEETTVTVEAAFGRRHAQASTNQTDRASLQAAVEMAARLARLAPEDPEWMGPLGPTRHRAGAPAWDPATARLAAPARAEAVAAAVRAADEGKLEAAGYLEHRARAWAIATSAGLRAHHPSTHASLTTTARTADGRGSGWAGAVSHRWGDLDAGALAAAASDRAVRSAGGRRLAPGRYTVVLEPAAVGELLSFLASSLDARRADEGRSFFSRPGGGNRVGEAIFGDAITLRSDPTDPATPAATFDGEGTPLEPTTWIDRGRLAGLVTSRHWAAEKGGRPTGQPNVFHLAGGTASREELLRGVKRGLLVTRFWYTRWVDPRQILITGLTRDGVFLIEDGELVAPVTNFRFNESPVTMLRNADAIGRETVRIPYGGGRFRVPALRTHEFHMASVSDAV